MAEARLRLTQVYANAGRRPIAPGADWVEIGFELGVLEFGGDAGARELGGNAGVKV